MNDSPQHVVKRTPVVVIVDDEDVVTQSLTAFLNLEGDYEILAFQDPRQAIAAVRSRAIDVVVSDFLMPVMNGLEFLLEVRRLRPDVPRIMLTGYADKENSIRAINEVGLFQYIEKPWDNEYFKLVIDNAIRNKTLEESLGERIRDLDALLRERSRLVERNELLRNELTTARRLQQSLLPQALPDAHGFSMSARYCPALEIGGDFYDAIPLSSDTVGVLIADATGHGIQAALSTALVKFAFTRFAHSDAGPADILFGMNQVLGQGLPEETFVAAQVAVLNTKSGRIDIANAGNPHPWLLRASSREPELVAANGLALGIFDKEMYKPDAPVQIEMQRGDGVLLYTDGLSEIENDRGQLFQEGEFRRVLSQQHVTPAELLCERLIEAGRKFSRPDHEWDDVTLFGIERS